MSDDISMPDIASLIAAIPDGARLAVFKDSRVAMAATRALVRRGIKDLHLVCVPTSGLQADILIGAGCVATLETAGVTLSEHGPAPAFTRAVKSGAIALMETTCPAIYAGLQAAEKGLPFMPLRGLIGSDLLAHRADYETIDNPLGEDDPIVVLPPIAPDIALSHVPLADRHGNVWIGRQPELRLMAHAARQTLVTAEEISDENLLADETLAAATIPALYVHGVALAENGSWPLALTGRYGEDAAHLAEYARQAASADGFAAYLAEHVLAEREAAE